MCGNWAAIRAVANTPLKLGVLDRDLYKIFNPFSDHRDFGHKYDCPGWLRQYGKGHQDHDNRTNYNAVRRADIVVDNDNDTTNAPLKCGTERGSSIDAVRLRWAL